MEEFDSETLNRFLEKGIAELSGMTENGEATYRLDMEKMAKLEPEIYEEICERDLQKILDSLYQKGLVEIEIGDDLEIGYYIPDSAKETLKELGYVVMDDDEDE